MVGLYRPLEGKILYNNIDGNNIDFDTLRIQIGFVTQDTQLFAGTIKENMLFVNPNVTDEEVFLSKRIKNHTKNNCKGNHFTCGNYNRKLEEYRVS